MSETILYVAVDGDDLNEGTETRPFASLARARDAARELCGEQAVPVTVRVHGGTYYHSEPLRFEPQHSGTADAPIRYEAYPGEKPVLSGGTRLDLDWRPYKDGIMKADLSAMALANADQLFVDRERKHRARYPNYDPENPRKDGKGYIESGAQNGLPPTELQFDPATFTKKKWAHPEEAVLHSFQSYSWGNLIWRLRGIDYDRNAFLLGRGGWHMNTLWSKWAVAASDAPFFVENVFEELDTPGEWYLDSREGVLYYMPEPGECLETALVEVPLLTQVIEFRGSQDNPVHHITFSGFQVAHTRTVYLEPWEAPSLGDWTIHRSGAVFFEGAEDCAFEDAVFHATGGSAVFINNYNRRNRVCNSTFTETGESAVCIVGTHNSRFGTNLPFPAECVVHNNLIHDCGVYGKQIAGVFISRSEKNTISHNEIHTMPRSAICINDGTWGGHIVEYNRLYNTCLESGDHGPFNSWGRDRHWCLQQSHGPNHPSHKAGNVLEDALYTTEIRYNYVEDDEWGIDLDDGTSNYHIHHNLCIGCPIKFREGALRLVENNVIIAPGHSIYFGCSYEDNEDRFLRNIVYVVADREHDHNYSISKEGKKGVFYHATHTPIHGLWAQELDHNCFWSDCDEWWALITPSDDGERSGEPTNVLSLEDWRELGFDRNSVVADPMFIDADNNDYRVHPESPALKLGFENFDMDKFGLL